MPYPYTLMPDGHTMEEEVKPPAETQEESTRPNSPFHDFGNPSPSPSRPSSLPPPPSPPGGDQPSQSPHDYADGPASQSSGQGSSSKSDKQGSTGSSPREIRPPAPVHRQPILVPPDILDISEDAVDSLEQHIAALYDGQPIAGSARPIEQAPTPVTDEFGYTPLTPGQEMDVDYLLSFVTNTLARDVLITMKRDGIPPRSQRNEFMSPHAEWGWDATSDTLALEMIDKVEQSEMDEILAHAESTQEDAEHEQPYIPTIGVKVSGTLRVYSDEAFDPTVDTPIYTHSNAYTSAPLSVIRYSKLNAFRVLIQIGELRYWIDTTDEDAQFTFVALGEHGDTSEQEAEGAVATETESEYYRQSIARGEDTGKENVEISHRVYADRTEDQLGWLTRDYNTTTNTKFDVQSSVIGPDVRVELVIHAKSDPEGRLGNYVVISFPAFVYLSDPEIMQQLKMQNLASQRLWDRSLTEEDLAMRAQMQRMARLTAHNPELWHEDDRIFMAYAHLSRIEPHIVAGLHIDDADKSLIGKTGNTGKGIQYHHLDLLEVIVGSSDPGSGALERMLDRLRQKYVVEGSQDVQHFFDLVIESQLYPHGGSSLYSENLDTARTHPELDDTFRIAQYLSKEADPKDSIYFEDE